ncbi:hypothetical protein SOVF_184020, partial [Spinacia oleracea]
MADNRKKPLHIAMYPWFAFGHLTSFLHLANKLAEKHHKISIFLPTKTQTKLASHNHHPNLITFIPLTLPTVPGLPPEAETTNDLPPSAWPQLMDAMDMTRDIIDSHLSNLKPDFVFYDFAFWLPEVACKHGSKSICYYATYLVNLAYGHPRSRNQPANHQFTEAELMQPPPNSPCEAVRLLGCEARELSRVFKFEFGGGISFLERITICFEAGDALAAKTCREMEGTYCHFVQQILKKPVLVIGPVVPESPASQLDHHFDCWLKEFGSASVIYCALGSERVLDKDQFQDLVLGLELTGRPFLAALKPPTGYKTIESALPSGFEERTKGRGIVHGGWVQQQLILQHPSVGCFVTHCGAGSLSEGMVSECQLVFLPQAVDQFLNARLMSLELKVGVEVQKQENDGFFTKEAVNKAVSTVMEEGNEIGKE